ncbi:23S rRNA (adenine(2503)-C(2))-methyltransferase RlmN [Candidatus Uhrbacteria bacterium CG10_big_fil_rev_8_21_14_0_10_48_16]|uniref:23S rRNA (Adenine(2503)-C(2))-methyltransferase RlmN n=1 Tax=Candidatus Uhrbacteria bacterium CG10_big_fil_rev_8_21_14_0_10_48_16 TaxID=1975038 RepID=A0A2M8LHY0_9BACT|nr:MAG: 23S rRNA (adenine(2503)-C(2))-methyltransferase RlmN [Candidatus Uhrbacteria bacterium CG10_big_fil_rev_8_21_14_0_10_48_16]
MIESRHKQFTTLFPTEPAFRWKQVEQGLFSFATSWEELTSLSKYIREHIGSIPWMTVTPQKIQISGNGDTHKALLRVEGDQDIETVLMKNKRDAWTICVSSQVGCAMRCGFCATGKMGLIRSLTSDEIVDQYRFWMQYLQEHKELEGRISNIVFMGMGEPLANYEEVKYALNAILKHSDIGRTRITVSTVGVLPRLEQMLTDKDWPHVRLAISLHSAVSETRKQIVPTSYDDFLPKLGDWAKRYLYRHGNRRHHLTFEYVMLKGVNDTPDQARALAKFVNRIGNVRVNLIPYNLTGLEFECSTPPAIKQFLEILQSKHVISTTRRTMGDDIDAACGQLAGSKEKT